MINEMDEPMEKIHKKRGRKPKGGKIVKNDPKINVHNPNHTNVILHLKCRISDIPSFQDMTKYNPDMCTIEPFEEDHTFGTYNATEPMVQDKRDISKGERQKKEIYHKLADLETQLHNNQVNQKSACFWCTCDFETPTIYIPSLFFKGKYNVYGCFCSPECACSHLFKENIDQTIKYERYQLLNLLYSKVYQYERNIKFAPNPYYLLEKYMGNLTIDEYRQLLTYDRVMLVLDKPLTKIYPELHEDNNEFETVYDNKLNLKRNNKIEKNQAISNVFHA